MRYVASALHSSINIRLHQKRKILVNSLKCYNWVAGVNRAHDFPPVGETEPRSRGGEDVPGSHRGVRPDEGGQPFGPGCGGSTCQVRLLRHLSLFLTFPSILQQQTLNSCLMSPLMMICVFKIKEPAEYTSIVLHVRLLSHPCWLVVVTSTVINCLLHLRVLQPCRGFRLFWNDFMYISVQQAQHLWEMWFKGFLPCF